MPISRRGALDASHLDGVLTLDVERGVAAIDLAEVSFVDAYALAGLACFIASAARGGLPVELVVPEDPTFGAGSPGCISAMSWIHSGSCVEGAFPGVAERDRRDALIELERFGDVHGGDRLASFTWERLEGGVDAEVVYQLFEATGELGLNVVEHAGSPAGGFVVAQRYKAGVRGLGGIVWIRSGSALRTITRGTRTTLGVSRLQGAIVGARLPCRPGRVATERR